MAMAMAMTTALLVLLVAAPAVHAVQHNVGGSNGWSQSTDFPTWVSGQTFTVGDTLLFSYSSSHGVDVVSQDDYNNCNTGNALNSYTGGSTTITLSNPGTMYFICPSFGHCQGGMKLAITAAAGGTTPSTGTSPATPSTPAGSSPTTPSTSGSTPSITTNTSPSHTYSAAGRMFGEMNRVVIGFSVVVAVLVAFMG